MKRLVTAAAAALLTCTRFAVADGAQDVHLPYADAGLDEREAAAFLLDRLTFGARPGEVDRVVAMGLERWVESQLASAFPEHELEARLARFEALRMSDAELIARYPSSSQLSAHVRRFHPGLIPGRDEPVMDFSVVTAKLDAFRAERGILTQDRELKDQVLEQKVIRSVYAENQLREVLTDFWQNHFFTSPVSFNARAWVLGFERDAVRPNALGSFRTLLGATARHPAMLQYYLGLAAPARLGPGDSTLDVELAKLAARDPAAAEELAAAVREEIASLEHEEDLVLAREFWPATGPNEPHARALVALQTLGPDGPFTDADIAEVARVFTGWGAAPIGPSPEWFATGLARAQQAGFVRDGSFLFRADRHDALAKRPLGLELAAGGGVEEGERVLDFLASHPSTARHIARKLAVRFVSEEPPAPLVERLAQSFQASSGDIAAVMRALLQSPEFWAAAKQRQKVKSPLELAASALRATAADVADATAVVGRIAAMGQPLYGYLEPTGFPDRAEHWLDPAALLARLDFAADLAANAIEGVTIDPAAIAGTGHLPPEQLLAVVAGRLLPGREVAPTIERLRGAVGEAAEPMTAAVGLVVASPEFQLR